MIHVRGKPEFVVFHRKELDAYLAQEARHRGLIIHENETALVLDWKRDGIQVTTSKGKYLAQVVVGADGSKGLTRRRVGGKLAPAGWRACSKSFTQPRAPHPQFTEKYALFDFTDLRKDLQGYTWGFSRTRRRGAAFQSRCV
ncbi:MAG: hypothetical protein HC806_00495 [Anaerolineae bacterium]|nr:hypothetical protein [Anaerolineae bacterium]